MSTEQNQEVTVSPEGTEGEQAGEDVATLKAKLTELEATVGSTKRELKDARKALEEAKRALDPGTPKEPQQPSEPDYAKLGFLNSVQVSHPDDQKLVLDEATRLKLPLSDVLQMEHIKGKLEASKNQREAQEGMPNGSGRKGGANKGDVDYYLAHPDEVPTDLELHNKVIDARMKKIEDGSRFSEVPFIG